MIRCYKPVLALLSHLAANTHERSLPGHASIAGKCRWTGAAGKEEVATSCPYPADGKPAIDTRCGVY
jgi:hypothetical protein